MARRDAILQPGCQAELLTSTITFVFDVHMSILDGSLGILPRRLMVAREDAFMARSILRDNGIELSEKK